MAASASANEPSIETWRAGAHTVVIVTGRMTVDSSPHLRPVWHEAIGGSAAGRGRHRFHGGSISGHFRDCDAARGSDAGVETGRAARRDRGAASERAHGVGDWSRRITLAPKYLGALICRGPDAAVRQNPSPPFATNQATALKPPVYPLGPDRPKAAIRLSERVDFHVGELDAPLAQGPEGFDRSLEKIRTELLVCQNLADNQLHGFLRHDLYAVGRLPPSSGSVLNLAPSRRRKSNVAAAVRFARNPRQSADSVRHDRLRSV
jgi:hypothetical protein